MGIFLILLMLDGLPSLDFEVFQSMAECNKRKVDLLLKFEENQMPKPLYFECKSREYPKQEVSM